MQNSFTLQKLLSIFNASVLGSFAVRDNIEPIRALMAVRFTCQEISRMYDSFAPWYDWVEAIPDGLGVRNLRQKLLRKAIGKTLEVAVGTGRNLKFHLQDCSITAVDLSIQMLNVARKRAGSRPIQVSFSRVDAEALPFDDKSFETVVSTLSTCTFPNPIAALQEMRRVCRGNGRVLLLEHGRSDHDWLGRWQDHHEDSFARQLGCHWNREPLDLVRKANFQIISAHRRFFGIFHLIEARPTKDAPPASCTG
jgi:ubiquinone/menaquinone biosynthesis C-methylase UbiE